LHVTGLLRQTTTQSNSDIENNSINHFIIHSNNACSVYHILQYPDIVSLQAIVGQSAGQAPTPADQAAATAAANVATSGAGENDPSESTSAALNAAGTFASYNPMAWLTSPPAPAASSDSTTNADSTNKADV
jgi:hypothetical protein